MTVIAKGVEALKTISHALEALKKLETLTDQAPIIATLSDAVLAARSVIESQENEMKTILAAKDNLEKEVIRLKAWDAERERYEKKEVAFHVFAYVLKQPLHRGEASQWLCGRCYDNFKKGGFQLFHHSAAEKVYKCDSCGGEIHIPSPSKPVKIVSPLGWT